MVDMERRPVWFVGATWDSAQPSDQTDRFLAEEVWENGYRDRYLDDVKSVEPGDRIVIKSTYTRKHRLPFDNRGVPVSTMKIKAIGKVTENPGDGRRLKVAWKPVLPPREWYFYTHRRTIWKVQRSSGAWLDAADALIRFALDGEPQDYESFLKSPLWENRYRFGWTTFFSEIADKLLQYRDDRRPLVDKLIAISWSVGMTFPEDRFADGTKGYLKDICPFSTFGCFNRYMKDDKRESIAWRSGDPTMLGQIDAILRHRYEIDRLRQWPYADFLPLIQSFDTLFEEQGWLIRTKL